MANFTVFYTHQNTGGSYDVKRMDVAVSPEAMRDAETTDFTTDEAQQTLRQLIFTKIGDVVDEDTTVDVQLTPTVN